MIPDSLKFEFFLQVMLIRFTVRLFLSQWDAHFRKVV